MNTFQQSIKEKISPIHRKNNLLLHGYLHWHVLKPASKAGIMTPLHKSEVCSYWCSQWMFPKVNHLYDHTYGAWLGHYSSSVCEINPSYIFYSCSRLSSWPRGRMKHVSLQRQYNHKTPALLLCNTLAISNKTMMTKGALLVYLPHYMISKVSRPKHYSRPHTFTDNQSQ